jgi:hypothetical protein
MQAIDTKRQQTLEQLQQVVTQCIEVQLCGGWMRVGHGVASLSGHGGDSAGVTKQRTVGTRKADQQRHLTTTRTHSARCHTRYDDAVQQVCHHATLEGQGGVRQAARQQTEGRGVRHQLVVKRWEWNQQREWHAHHAIAFDEQHGAINLDVCRRAGVMSAQRCTRVQWTRG